MPNPAEAAERLRTFAETIVGCVTKSVAPNSTSYERDLDKPCFGLAEPYELAVAYLAEHDPTPIDEDRLHDAGFAQVAHVFLSPASHRPGPVCYVRYEPDLGCDGWSVGWGDQFGTIPTMNTRGDLYRLCAALGIPLTAAQES